MVVDDDGVEKREKIFSIFLSLVYFFYLLFLFLLLVKSKGTKKMKEEGVKKKGGKKEKKRKEILLVFRERILRCDVCVCVRAFSSSGAFRIDRLSSSIVSRREKGTEEKEEGETRGQS